MSNIKVAIIEDNSNLRRGLVTLVNGSVGFECAGAWGNCDNLVKNIIDSKPDVILMDIGLPGMDGIEAVKMLKENPGFDVGIHLVLTSEWSSVKWRPLTHCPSLVDKDGYFFPMVWKNDNFPPNSSISEVNWKIEEIEKELRAQIEVSLKYLPNISHLSNHMGFTSLDPKLKELVEKLAKEYKLGTETNNLKYFNGWGRDAKPEERIDKFCENLEKLTPGKYLFVEHPAKDTEEMKTVGHKGYENVGLDREWVTRVFTSEKVKAVIQKKGIKLISYADLKEKN